MIFRSPELPEDYKQVLVLIEYLRDKLRFATTDSLNRWTGAVARMAYARAIHGSNTIEGINVSVDDAVQVVDGEEPLTPDAEDRHALIGYREAMDYIIQLKDDRTFTYNEGTLLGWHYMMMKYDLTKSPGRYRPGAIHVTNTATNQVVYEGPDAALVPELVRELIAFLNTKDNLHVIVKAAMAHLNLTMIHPFRDGNGRMARALQTMVLGREGIISPIFSSIEEYVGRNSQDYYNVLAEVGQGTWHPERDALPWIRFCLVAHYRQARTLLRRMSEMGRLMNTIEEELKKRKLHERLMFALVDAALNLPVRNHTYRKQTEISNQVAKRDLRILVDSGFLVPKGEKRGRLYTASNELRAIRETTALPREQFDPFAEIETNKLKGNPQQAEIPGL